MAFAYDTGVGSASYLDIIELAKMSGIPFNVTSTIRSAPQPGQRADFHMTGNAVDMAASPENMVKLAAWFNKLAPFELEEIHSGGGGFFVKNGNIVPSDFYASVISQHYNHVHIAMTKAGVAAARAALGGVLLGGGVSLPNPLEPLEQIRADIQAIKDVISAGVGFYKLLSDANTYKRLGYVALGLLFIVIGLGAIGVGNLDSAPVKTVVKAVAAGKVKVKG